MENTRILVVEDEPVVVEVVERYLLREGYSVLTAGEAEAGLQKYTESRPHLVVLDLMLPRLGGMEVCRRIRVMVEALVDGVVDDDQTRMRYLKTMGAQTQQLSALIDDLFELATIDAGELSLRVELLKVKDVMAETMDTFQPQAERAHIRLCFEPDKDTPSISADPQRLSRVLYSLLQNAMRLRPPMARSPCAPTLRWGPSPSRYRIRATASPPWTRPVSSTASTGARNRGHANSAAAGWASASRAASWKRTVAVSG